MYSRARKKTSRWCPRASAVERSKPRLRGWLSTDEEEIERRRVRATEEAIHIDTLESQDPYFGTFRASSAGGGEYWVEIRSLNEHVNSCGCPDHRVNGLGTCKHIEAVLLRLQKKRRRWYEEMVQVGSPHVEIYLDRREDKVRVRWPRRMSARARVRKALEGFFSSDGTLLADPTMALPALERELARVHGMRRTVRISRHLDSWLEEQRRRHASKKAREAFLADVAGGKRPLDVLDVPLYPYQHEGMLHLAFTGRALLADEMGLGKTVQAIAACELLRRLQGIQRVLVISPASLKAEWEEQITKFTGLPSLLLQGPRAARLRQYREPAFFYLANYEQILVDRTAIQEILAPDVIILDEAQRIKNWQAKTAQAVKRLESPYAFVLTGTPLENRIDEVYSIVQYLDPHLFGPLFRFNRDFHVLDDRGRPQGYQNLDEMHRRLRPVMLRRRKEEVEAELPGRTVNNYFVEMGPEQQDRYQEYSDKVARLLAQAKRRPLSAEEYEKLQRWLACMRMLCDTPYILDADCRVSPKLHELEAVLGDLMENDDHKVIVFSEWERMLKLVRELAEKMKLGFAWHTGSVPQPQRRKEIRRFKADAACRLFLSTDSGGVGLNLQAADVVINMDLPWNPAKLEQRIARAWRKQQTRPVQVINLVSEGTIEHRMLHLLGQKRLLAEGVVDGASEVKEMAMPSGRAAFVQRLQRMMGDLEQPAAEVPGRGQESTEPLERLREDAVARLSDRLDLLEAYAAKDGKRTVLAVLDRAEESAGAVLAKAAGEPLQNGMMGLEVLDRHTYETILRLTDAGVLSLNREGAETLHCSRVFAETRSRERKHRMATARKRMADAERKARMAALLADGGFAEEALAALTQAVETGLQSLAYALGEETGQALATGLIESKLVPKGILPSEACSLAKVLREKKDGRGEAGALARLDAGHSLLEQVATALESRA